MKKETFKERVERTLRSVGRPKGSVNSESHMEAIIEANTAEKSFYWGKKGSDHPLWGNKEKAELAKEKIAKKNSISNRKMKLVKSTEEIRIEYSLIEQHLADGWFFKAKKINMNNGIRTKMISPCDWEKYRNEGWEWGSMPQGIAAEDSV